MSTQPAEPLEIPPLDLIPKDPRREFAEGRRKFLGGSDAYALLNQPQYGQGCWTALAFDKLGVEPDFPKEMDEDLLRRGTLLEPIVAAQYMEETGRKVIQAPHDTYTALDGTKVRMPRARLSKEFPWAGVHVDRTILAASGTGVEETGDLEIKSRAEGPYLRVLRTGPFPGDVLQVQWANLVTGHSWGAFAMVGVFGSLPMKHFDFKRDEQVMDIFKRQGETFAGHVWGKNEVPPPMIAADDARCKICPWRMECRGEQTDAQLARAMKEEKKAKGELVTIQNVELAELLTRRTLADAEIKTAEAALEEYDKKIIALQGDRPKAYVLGFGKSYVMNATFNGLDQSRLKTEKPEIYEQYKVVGKATGQQFLRVYPDKE